MRNRMFDLFPVDSAHGLGWHQITCELPCDMGWGNRWQTHGLESVCEDAWYEHAADRHPRFLALDHERMLADLARFKVLEKS